MSKTITVLSIVAVVLLFASYSVVAEHQALAWNGVKKSDPVGTWHYQTRTEVHEEELLVQPH
jgi:type IV secretory pathway protease TraF